MVEKNFKYTTKIKQPQKVAGIKFIPGKEGTLTEREIKAIKKDKYGLSLIESGMLVIGNDPVAAAPASETIPDFDNTGAEEEKGDSD